MVNMPHEFFICLCCNFLQITLFALHLPLQTMKLREPNLPGTFWKAVYPNHDQFSLVLVLGLNTFPNHFIYNSRGVSANNTLSYEHVEISTLLVKVGMRKTVSFSSL